MAFVMVSTGALTDAGVRTLSLRRLACVGVGCASLLVALGVALGFALARPEATPVLRQLAGPRPEAYTVEQIGALSGRLFKLENEAHVLGRKIGVLEDFEARAAAKPAGGQLLAPRAAALPLAEVEQTLGRIEAHLAEVGRATTQRNLSHMFFPSRVPVEQVDIGSVFGNRVDPLTRRLAFHAGLDFAAEPGAPIHAAAGGIVAFAGWHPEFGWMVELDHGNRLTTRYAHASRLLVKTGAVVTPGAQVALVGSSGRSTGPHLHFEVLRDGQYVDPADYLSLR